MNRLASSSAKLLFLIVLPSPPPPPRSTDCPDGAEEAPAGLRGMNRVCPSTPSSSVSPAVPTHPSRPPQAFVDNKLGSMSYVASLPIKVTRRTSVWTTLLALHICGCHMTKSQPERLCRSLRSPSTAASTRTSPPSSRPGLCSGQWLVCSRKPERLSEKRRRQSSPPPPPPQHHLLPGRGSDSALLCAGEEGGASGQVLGGR